MDVTCYCGKGFNVKNPGLLLLESTQFCSVACLTQFLEDNQRDEEVFCKEEAMDFAPMDGRDVWDRVTKAFYRSKYEVNVARHLVYSDFKYQYEPKFLTIGKKRYAPDFWLTECHMFLEVKGLWGMGSKTKTRKAMEGHPIIIAPAHLSAEFARKYETKLDRVTR